MSNPSGLCLCGCDEKTKLAPCNDPRRGWVKGEPLRYIHGHQQRGRLRSSASKPYRENDATGCWEWIRAVTGGGYPMVGIGGTKSTVAHRVFYEAHVGPIPEGYQIDHLCGNRRCVNPAHLEPVTRRENARRGLNAKLDAEDVETLRGAWGEFAGPMREFARGAASILGVSHGHIEDILRGRTWRDGAVAT